MNVLHEASRKPAEAVYYIALPCTERCRMAPSYEYGVYRVDSPFEIYHRATREILRLNFDRDTEYWERLTLGVAGDVSSKRWISPPKWPDKWSGFRKSLVQAGVTKSESELYSI